MSWWIPLAFVAAGLAGVAIALSLTAGRPRSRPAAEAADGPGHGSARKSRYRQDNDLVWNPGAFMAAAGLIGAVVLIGVLIEVA
ncbi:MAG TPA: hypothetical protein VLA87_12835 [Gaiellaceae bacterium]|nr:hypothetical protein [Gaiellaceae bacterium]